MSVFAHADLEEQIVRFSIQLQNDPTNADLLLHRADVYRRHLQVAEALADYAAAEKLKPGWLDVTLGRAQLYFDIGETATATDAVNQILTIQPNSPAAHILRAECHLKLNQKEAAIADYSTVIESSATPQPDLLVERARIQAELKFWDAAIQGLDGGMKQLGQIPQLQVPAIEYERQRGNYSGALDRVDKIIAAYPVKEPWLTLRASILEQAGRFGEARENYRSALDGIEGYPPVRRGLEQTQHVEAQAREGLDRVEAKLSRTATAKTISSQNSTQ